MEQKASEIERELVKGPFGAYLELKEGVHPLELKYFLKSQSPFSHDALELLLKLIRRRRSSRMIQVGQKSYQVTRSHLFIYNTPFPCFFHHRSYWKHGEERGWQAFWKGVIDHQGEGALIELSELDPSSKKKVKQWYADHDVPSFFYDKAPIRLINDHAIEEYLTGSNLFYLRDLDKPTQKRKDHIKC